MKIAIEKFLIMTEKIANAGKISRTYGTDVTIHRSEIHIINLIGDYTGLHISEIARKFGVTKGAISQTLKRLERKGLVEKHLDETNNTRLLVKLTDKGMKAYTNHEAYHKEYDQEIFSYLNNLSAHELEVLITFMEKASNMADRHL